MTDTLAIGVLLTLIGLMLQLMMLLAFDLPELHHLRSFWTGPKWLWRNLNWWGRSYLVGTTLLLWTGETLVLVELVG